MTEIMKLSQVSKRFSRRRVLSDVSLTVHQGETAVSYTHLTLPTNSLV